MSLAFDCILRLTAWLRCCYHAGCWLKVNHPDGDEFYHNPVRWCMGLHRALG